MTLETGVKELAEAVGADVKALEDGKVNSNDPRLTDAREWSAATVLQAEAEEGTASTRRAWTAQRVWQAINAWWQLVTSGFGRNFIAASNEQDARNVLQLGAAATRDVGVSSGNVMEVGAGGLLTGEVTNWDSFATVAFNQGVRTEMGSGVNLDNPYGIYDTTGRAHHFAFGNPSYPAGLFCDGDDGTENIKLVFYAHGGSSPRRFAVISHSGNLKQSTGQETMYPMSQKAVTDAINARGFVDASGILTVTSGALSNDMSEFLSLNTYADMSVKIQGLHSYAELSNNSTSSTPMAGYYYLLPRTNEAALTHTFTCTYSATTVKTWRMLVSRTWATASYITPSFEITGLSGSVKIKSSISSTMKNFLIEFTQIGQDVIGQIVAEWA